MRHSIRLLVGIAAGVLIAGTTHAAPIKWHGTSIFRLGTAKPTIASGTGIATVNGSSGLGHLNQIRVQGLSSTGTVPVTDPEVIADGIVAIQFNSPGTTGGGTGGGLPQTPGFGTLGGISGGPPLTDAINPVPGFSRVCLIDPNCGFALILNFTQHTTASTTVGFGIGGLITVGGSSTIRISVTANPWTLGQATALDETDNNAIITRAVTGFAHGPASLTSSTAVPSGVVQFVTPLQVTTNLTGGSTRLISLLGRVRYHFVPEPGMLLLLGSGVVALVLLGRSRMK